MNKDKEMERMLPDMKCGYGLWRRKEPHGGYSYWSDYIPGGVRVFDEGLDDARATLEVLERTGWLPVGTYVKYFDEAGKPRPPQDAAIREAVKETIDEIKYWHGTEREDRPDGWNRVVDSLTKSISTDQPDNSDYSSQAALDRMLDDTLTTGIGYGKVNMGGSIKHVKRSEVIDQSSLIAELEARNKALSEAYIELYDMAADYPYRGGACVLSQLVETQSGFSEDIKARVIGDIDQSLAENGEQNDR